jgi:signal transduction histidine kinase
MNASGNSRTLQIAPQTLKSRLITADRKSVDRRAFIRYDERQRGIREKSLGGYMGQVESMPRGGHSAGRDKSLNNRCNAAGAAIARGVAPRGALPLLGLGGAALAAPVALHAAAVTATPLRAATEMMMTLFVLAAAWLLRAEFTSTRRLQELLLLAAALVLGLINLGAAVLPAAFDLQAGSYFAVAQLWGTVFVGALFAAAAYVPANWLVAKSHHPVATLAGLSVAGVLIAALGGLLGHSAAGVHSLPGALSHPTLLVLVVAATGLLAHAAVGFATRRPGDPSARLFAVAMVLMAGPVFSSVMAQSLAPGRIDAGDGLRGVAMGLILAAALVRERHVRARSSRATALAERRRVARDLHDGIAQDLAFIAAHGPRFVEELGDDHPVVIAARRALEISRSTISELSDPDGATAHESLEAVAQELGERFQISVAVNARLDRELEAHERETVTRIVREAIANAARHGGARNVIVSLTHTGTSLALRVVDDGRGICGHDLAPAPEGFGLRSMRERTAALGGHLHVRQPRRGGTELEVVLP